MAIWLQDLAFWTEHHLSNNKNIFNGLCWSYSTIESIGDRFPYLSKSQRETMLNNSIKEGLVTKGNFNKNSYDRTTWYALTPKAYVYFPYLLTEKYIERMYLSISEKSEMDFGNFRNLFPEIRTTIPDTKTDTKNRYKHICAPEVAPVYNLENSFSENQGDFPTDQPLSIDQESKEGFPGGGGHNNQALLEIGGNPGENRTERITKSDYQKNQTKNKSNSSNLVQYTIKDMQESDNFQIPRDLLADFLIVRNKKKAAMTKTSWKRIQSQLARCKENNIDPIEAFTYMVAKGWQSMEYEWIKAGVPTQYQKAESEKRALEREARAKQEKLREIEASKNVFSVITNRTNFREQQEKMKAEAKSRGVSIADLSRQILNHAKQQAYA
jgi:hypothetical protein